MKRRLLKALFATCCLGGLVACKPPEPPRPDISAETAVVEEKIRKFKADPSAPNREEVDKALAELSAKIKELEAREKTVKGAEKNETTGKLSALRIQYNLYVVDVTAVRVQTATGRTLEKAGDAVKDAGEAVKEAADSVTDSLKSDKAED
jgi:hypothetical protein